MSRRVFYALNVRLPRPLEFCMDAARLAVEQQAHKQAVEAGYEPDGPCEWEHVEDLDYLCKQPATAPSDTEVVTPIGSEGA